MGGTADTVNAIVVDPWSLTCVTCGKNLIASRNEQHQWSLPHLQAIADLHTERMHGEGTDAAPMAGGSH